MPPFVPELPFSVRRDDRDGVPVIVAEGSIDFVSAAELERELDGLRAAVLDLSAVDFVDSTVVRLLLTTAERLGYRLVLVTRQSGPAQHILQRYGIVTIFNVSNSRSGAIEIVLRAQRA